MVMLSRKAKDEPEQRMVVLACNPSTQEAEAGGSGVQSQPGLHSRKNKTMKKRKDEGMSEWMKEEKAKEPVRRLLGQPSKRYSALV
jgi:hypothetical protein